MKTSRKRNATKVSSAPRDKPQARDIRKAKDSFANTARRLECDEDKERFEMKLGKIAQPKRKELSR